MPKIFLKTLSIFRKKKIVYLKFANYYKKFLVDKENQMRYSLLRLQLLNVNDANERNTQDVSLDN